MKKVGQAGTLPGTGGFTVAMFHASEVPVGTSIYIVDPSDELPDRYIEEYQQTNHYVLEDLEALVTDIEEMRISRGQKDFLKGRLKEIYDMINEIDGEEDD